MTVRSLILLPGLDGTGTLYTNLVSEFPSTLNITTVRYPTERFLSYSQLATWLNDVVPSTAPFVLVAESFSVPVAAKFAGTWPSNLQGLVLAAGFVSNPVGWGRLFLKPLTMRLLYKLPPPNLALDFLLIGLNPPPALRTAIHHALRLVKPDVLARRVRAALNCDARDDLRRVKVPLMFIRPEHDRLIRQNCVRELQQIRPDAAWTSIAGPHLVLQREPRKSAEAIVRFLSSLEGGAHNRKRPG